MCWVVGYLADWFSVGYLFRVIIKCYKLCLQAHPLQYVVFVYKAIFSLLSVGPKQAYKYVFKTDDDQNLINEKFFEVLYKILLQTSGPPIHYGGHIVEITRPFISEYYKIHSELPKNIPIQITKYCSGRFYFLSSKALRNLITKRESIIKEFLEDYAIGYNLHIFFKSNMLKLNTDKAFVDIPL